MQQNKICNVKVKKKNYNEVRKSHKTSSYYIFRLGEEYRQSLSNLQKEYVANRLTKESYNA